MAVRVLIVDPDRTLLDGYCAYFERAGLDTITATNGSDGESLLLQGSIDVLVLEPDLPHRGGELVLTAMASQTDRRPLPVVAVSRRTRLELNFPVHEYHVKPVRMSTLVRSILDAADGT